MLRRDSCWLAPAFTDSPPELQASECVDGATFRPWNRTGFFTLLHSGKRNRHLVPNFGTAPPLSSPKVGELGLGLCHSSLCSRRGPARRMAWSRAQFQCFRQAKSATEAAAGFLLSVAFPRHLDRVSFLFCACHPRCSCFFLPRKSCGGHQ